MLSKRLIALLLALTFALVGCGSSKDDDTSKASSSDDTSSTDSGAEQGGEVVESADLAAGEEVTVDDFIGRLQPVLESNEPYAINMTMGGGVTAEGVVQGGDEPRMKMSMEVSGQKIEIITAGDRYLMKMGAATQNKWAEIDLSQANVPLPSSTNQDPLAQLQEMKGAITSITFEGTESVDGEDLQKFVVALDAKKALKKQLGDEVPAEALQSMPKNLEYEYYLDSKDRPRAVKMQIMGQTIDAKMSDYGKVDPVELPDESEITKGANPFGG